MNKVDLGKYLLFEDGTLINKKNGRKLKPIDNPKGYKFYIINITGKQTTHLIHRLVYEKFVGKIKKPLEINHKDGNKANNHISNLELVTHRDNIIHAVNIGSIKSGKDAHASKGEVEKIHPITKEVLKVYGSQRQASIIENISYSSICQCVNYLRHSAGGYLWRYKTNNNG
jgi:hypothetical protein